MPEQYIEVQFGRRFDTVWHIFKGDPREIAPMCGLIEEAEIISDTFAPGASMCKKCLHSYDYSDPYIRKVREWYDTPVHQRESLPIPRES